MYNQITVFSSSISPSTSGEISKLKYFVLILVGHNNLRHMNFQV